MLAIYIFHCMAIFWVVCKLPRKLTYFHIVSLDWRSSTLDKQFQYLNLEKSESSEVDNSEKLHRKDTDELDTLTKLHWLHDTQKQKQ